MRVGQLLLTGVLLASAGGMVYSLQTLVESGVQPMEERIASARSGDPQPLQPVLPAAELFAPLPLAEFIEITARPLFSPSRRPPPPEIADATPEAPAANPAAAPETNQFMVIGIVIAPDEKVALLKQLRKNNEIVHVKEGETLSEWTVAQISPESVTMQQQGVTDVVKLSDNVLSDAEKRVLSQRAKQEELNAARREQQADRVENNAEQNATHQRRFAGQSPQLKRPVRRIRNPSPRVRNRN